MCSWKFSIHIDEITFSNSSFVHYGTTALPLGIAFVLIHGFASIYCNLISFFKLLRNVVYTILDSLVEYILSFNRNRRKSLNCTTVISVSFLLLKRCVILLETV